VLNSDEEVLLRGGSRDRCGQCGVAVGQAGRNGDVELIEPRAADACERDFSHYAADRDPYRVSQRRGRGLPATCRQRRLRRAESRAEQKDGFTGLGRCEGGSGNQSGLAHWQPEGCTAAGYFGLNRKNAGATPPEVAVKLLLVPPAVVTCTSTGPDGR